MQLHRSAGYLRTSWLQSARHTKPQMLVRANRCSGKREADGRFKAPPDFVALDRGQSRVTMNSRKSKYSLRVTVSHMQAINLFS